MASYGSVVFEESGLVCLEIRALEDDSLLAKETITVDDTPERNN